MAKYYEITKSSYARDIDHLVTFNKNGLWIKENLDTKQRIISAAKPDGINLIDVTIFHLDKKSNLIEKISSKKSNIRNNDWLLEEVTIFRPVDGVLKEEKLDTYSINSIYDFDKINSLFRNFDTMSFVNLIINYNNLLKSGYNKTFLDQEFAFNVIFALFPFFNDRVICNFNNEYS